MKALFWHDETMGAEYTVEEIPASLQSEAEEWHDKMLEKIAEYDDDLMTKYFDDPSTITIEEIKRALRKATLSMNLVPMILGSSFKNKGVQCLLDAVCAYLPSPVDSGAIEGHSLDDADKVETREPSSDAPMCALAFKIATDPYVGRLTFFRVYSGDVVAVLTSTTHAQARRNAYRVCSRCTQTSRTRWKRSVAAISVRRRFQGYPYGDTLCAEDAPIVLEAMGFPDP